jgi:plastocyanin
LLGHRGLLRLMTWLRYVILSVGSASVALAFALPASAERAVAHATIVKVQIGTDAGEFTYKLTPNSVKVGTVIFKVSNHGMFSHDFKVCASNKGGHANSCAGTGTALLSSNQSATLKITFKKKGFYEYLCTVQAEADAGNGNTLSQAARGMKGVLKVG